MGIAERRNQIIHNQSWGLQHLSQELIETIHRKSVNVLHSLWDVIFTVLTQK